MPTATEEGQFEPCDLSGTPQWQFCAFGVVGTGFTKAAALSDWEENVDLMLEDDDKKRARVLAERMWVSLEEDGGLV